MTLDMSQIANAQIDDSGPALVVRVQLSDGTRMTIPQRDDCAEWIALQAWATTGGTIDPAPPH